MVITASIFQISSIRSCNNICKCASSRVVFPDALIKREACPDKSIASVSLAIDMALFKEFRSSRLRFTEPFVDEFFLLKVFSVLVAEKLHPLHP